MRPLPRRVRPSAALAPRLALGLCLALGACNASGDLGAAAPPSTRVAARPGYSPRGATLAFGALEGAPAAVAARFAALANAEAASRGVEVAQSQQAKYVARGYLSAAPNEAGGVTLRCVWDVFDAQHRRVQRAEDAAAAKTVSDDPWGAADDAALTALAARGADDLAAILTNTPDAEPAGAQAVGALPPSASAYR